MKIRGASASKPKSHVKRAKVPIKVESVSYKCHHKKVWFHNTSPRHLSGEALNCWWTYDSPWTPERKRAIEHIHISSPSFPSSIVLTNEQPEIAPSSMGVAMTSIFPYLHLFFHQQSAISNYFTSTLLNQLNRCPCNLLELRTSE